MPGVLMGCVEVDASQTFRRKCQHGRGRRSPPPSLSIPQDGLVDAPTRHAPLRPAGAALPQHDPLLPNRRPHLWHTLQKAEAAAVEDSRRADAAAMHALDRTAAYFNARRPERMVLELEAYRMRKEPSSRSWNGWGSGGGGGSSPAG